MIEDEISLADYWKALVKRRRLIGAIVGAAFISSVVVSLLLPKAYSATARILLPQQDALRFPVSLLAQASEGAGGLAEGLLGQNTSSEICKEILKSDSVLDAVINRFGLMNVYKVNSIEDARRVLDDRSRVAKTKAGTLSITVDDKDPKRAADMANAFVEELDKFNKSKHMSTGANNRVFIENRLQETKLKLTEDEEALKIFQQTSGAVKMDVQAQTIMDNLGKAKGELMAKEVELRTLLSYATPSNPRVELLRTDVAELKEELARLEDGRKGGFQAKDGDVFIPTSDIPNLSERYNKLVRDIKIQENLYGLLVAQYEQARIQEVKDSPTVQVMDWARVPIKSSKPKRAAIVVLTTTMAAILVVFMVFILERLEASGVGADKGMPR